jgi:hypothetical protein
MRKFLLPLLLVLALAHPTQAQTVTWLESGTDLFQTTDTYFGIQGLATSATDQKCTGTSSLKLNTNSPAAQAGADSPHGVCTDAGCQIHFCFRTDTYPSVSNSIMLRIRTSGGTQLYRLRLKPDGKLLNDPVTTVDTSVTGTATISLNTNTEIVVSGYMANTTTYAFKVYVNDVLDSTATGGTLSNVGMDDFKFFAETNLGTNAHYWIDDVYVATGGASSSSQPSTGSLSVTAKLPVTNGTLNQLTSEVGTGPAPNGISCGMGCHASNVSERPTSITYGWAINTPGTPKTEAYNIQSVSAGDVDITGKTILGYVGVVRTNVHTGTATNSIMLNGSSSGTIAVTSAVTTFSKAATSSTYPPGTGADVGLVTDSTAAIHSLFEAGVEVAYLNSAAPSTPRGGLTTLGVGN